MIKKLLFSLAIIISGVTLLNAQCTPDGSYTSPGIYPDTTTNLPHATVSVPYFTTVTVVIPTDTVIFMPLIVDSAGIIQLTGLPTGLTWQSNSASNYWDGGASGCVLVSGTTSQVGTFPLTIQTKTYLIGMVPLTNNVYGYKIIVDAAAGIQNMDQGKFDVYQNSPNPFSETTTIVFDSPNSEKYNFTVLNVIGEKVFEKTINASIGENKIEFSASGLSSGIYMYKLSNNNQTITKRMIIEGK